MAVIPVPLSERKPNTVDRLQKEIEEIQKGCSHDFRPFEQFPLENSLVEGVFILYDRLKARAHSENEKQRREAIRLQCLYCSAEAHVDISKDCPSCLGMLRKEILKKRAEFFGSDYLYYSARLYECTQCGLCWVADEWDQ